MGKKIILCIIAIAVMTVILWTGASKIEEGSWFNAGGDTAVRIAENQKIEDVLVTPIEGDIGDELIFDEKTYKMFCQFSRQYEGYNDYLASHGCTICSLTTILRAYTDECSSWTPYETITIAEKEMAGEDVFRKNYSKPMRKQMPITFYGVSMVLEKYGVSHEHVKTFTSDAEAKEDIISHLRTGDPVIFIISQHNRTTGEHSSKWTGSYHTMIMVGVDENDNVLIANPAGRQRFQMVPLDEMLSYMFSCTEEPDGFYWNGKSKNGGYIKINSNL